MKNVIFLLGCLFAISLFSCTDNMNDESVGKEDECAGTSYTYSDDIKSIIDSNCAVSGCHNGNQGIPNFSTYSGIAANAFAAASRVTSGSMPPASSGRFLTESQILKIKCWAESGATE